VVTSGDNLLINLEINEIIKPDFPIWISPFLSGGIKACVLISPKDFF